MSDSNSNNEISPLVVDRLDHDDFSRRLLAFIEEEGKSKVISLRGPWGRGKTDVLQRTYRVALDRKNSDNSDVCGVTWINPWQYGRADLITPLLTALISEIPVERLKKQREDIQKVAEKLIGAATGLALKLTGLDDISKLASTLVDKFVEGKGALAVSKDPVAPLGVAFNELVSNYIADQRKAEKNQFLIFVDDLDRCLPERQIALLEAFHFLVDSGAPATIVMAVDAEILSVAAQAHYKSKSFDVNRYLEKIFDFNIELPPLTGESLKPLVSEVAARITKFAQVRNVSFQRADFVDTFLKVLEMDWRFRNPRTLERLSSKIMRVVQDYGEVPDSLDLVLFWLVYLQSWPEARLTLDQALDRGAENPTGSRSQQDAQAVMEIAREATSKHFRFFHGKKKIQIGQKAYALAEVVQVYVTLNEKLRRLGL